jgi:hypothetical protein
MEETVNATNSTEVADEPPDTQRVSTLIWSGALPRGTWAFTLLRRSAKALIAHKGPFLWATFVFASPLLAALAIFMMYPASLLWRNWAYAGMWMSLASASLVTPLAIATVASWYQQRARTDTPNIELSIRTALEKIIPVLGTGLLIRGVAAIAYWQCSWIASHVNQLFEEPPAQLEPALAVAVVVLVGILIVPFFLAIPALVFEGISPLAALARSTKPRRSHRLVLGANVVAVEVVAVALGAVVYSLLDPIVGARFWRGLLGAVHMAVIGIPLTAFEGVLFPFAYLYLVQPAVSGSGSGTGADRGSGLREPSSSSNRPEVI